MVRMRRHGMLSTSETPLSKLEEVSHLTGLPIRPAIRGKNFLLDFYVVADSEQERVLFKVCAEKGIPLSRVPIEYEIWDWAEFDVLHFVRFFPPERVEHTGDGPEDFYGLAPGGCTECLRDRIQTGDLRLEFPEGEDPTDLAMTLDLEIIMSTRLLDKLQKAGVTGFSTRPLKGELAQGYRQVVVEGFMPPMTSVEWMQEGVCSGCGRPRLYRRSPINYLREQLNLPHDFAWSREQQGIIGSRDLFVSQRAYRILKELEPTLDSWGGFLVVEGQAGR